MLTPEIAVDAEWVLNIKINPESPNEFGEGRYGLLK
jgi:hypothetical protein